MHKFRTVLALPLLGAFYASIVLSGFIAWCANAVAGYDGLISFNSVNQSTGAELVRVDMNE